MERLLLIVNMAIDYLAATSTNSTLRLDCELLRTSEEQCNVATRQVLAIALQVLQSELSAAITRFACSEECVSICGQAVRAPTTREVTQAMCYLETLAEYYGALPDHFADLQIHEWTTHTVNWEERV